MTRFSYDWNDPDSAVGAIVCAVESMSGIEATSLPPLHRSVDPDALGDLLASLRAAGVRDGSVTFPYGRYRITATADGTIDVLPWRAPGEGAAATVEGFEAGMARLLREATANGVDVDGRWEVLTRSDGRAWTVEISGLSPGTEPD